MKELASLGVRSHYDLKEGIYMYVCIICMEGMMSKKMKLIILIAGTSHVFLLHM